MLNRHLYSVQDLNSPTKEPLAPTDEILLQFDQQLRVKYGAIHAPNLLRRFGLEDGDFQLDALGCPILEYEFLNGMNTHKLLKELGEMANALNIRLMKIDDEPVFA